MKSLDILNQNEHILTLKKIVTDVLEKHPIKENESVKNYNKKVLYQLEKHFDLSLYECSVEKKISFANFEMSSDYDLKIEIKEPTESFYLSLLIIKVETIKKQCEIEAVFRQKKEKSDITFNIQSDLLAIDLWMENINCTGFIYLDNGDFADKECLGNNYEIKKSLSFRKMKDFIDFFSVDDDFFYDAIIRLLNGKDFSVEEKEMILLEKEINLLNNEGYKLIKSDQSLYDVELFKPKQLHIKNKPKF